MRIGQSAAKPRTEEGSTTRVGILVGESSPKWNAPKSYMDMVNDMVCALVKAKENSQNVKSIRCNEPFSNITGNRGMVKCSFR